MPRAMPVLLLSLLLAGCDSSGDTPPADEAAANGPPGAGPAPKDSESAAEESEADDLSTFAELEADPRIPPVTQPWTGGYDEMIERRLIRVLTVYGPPRYYIDGAEERGVMHEAARMLENWVNRRESKRHLKVHVVLIPVARDELIGGLLEGRGDIAGADLTITPGRQALVDFTAPVTEEIREVLVTGDEAPPLNSLDDLAGKTVYARASSSYRESFEALNDRFEERGLDPVIIEHVSEHLEDADLLEMVHSGLLPWVAVDDYKARMWSGVFDNLVVRDDIVLRDAGRYGWAFRRNSPQLEEVLNGFIAEHGQGTLLGNVLINRYVRDFEWADTALAPADFKRCEDLLEVFERYAGQYGYDPLMVAAQAYQESRLDQNLRSPAGALGIMQILPTTAADPNVDIEDISDPESNVHAGIRYLNFLEKRYFSDPDLNDLNRTLFALAAYNAGPARVQRLRTRAAEQGYDPNQWFDHVEVVAARAIGRETVQYVANILKYYVAYRMSELSQRLRGQERSRAGIAMI